MRTSNAPTAARPERSTRASLAVLIGGYVALGIVAALATNGALVPLYVLVGFVLFVWVMGSPRFALAASVTLSLFLPSPFNFHIGPFTLTVGRVAGFFFLAAWLASLSRPDGAVYRRTPLDVALLFWLSTYALSIVTNSPMLDGAAMSDAIQATALVAVDFALFFVAAVSVLGAGRRHLEIVLRTLAAAVVVISFLALVEFVTRRNVFTFAAPVLPGGVRSLVLGVAEAINPERGGFRRVQGTFEGALRLGGVLCVALPVIVHYASRAADERRRRFYQVGAATCSLAALLTISRSVFVVLAVVIPVYLFASRQVRMTSSGVAAALLTLVVAIGLSPALRDTVIIYYEGLLTGEERSIRARLTDYDNVLRQFDETPITGSGPGTWSNRALSQPNNDKVDPDEPGATVLDNSLLLTIAERGALGLLGFLAVLGVGIGVAVRGVRRAATADDRSRRAALLASLLAYVLLTATYDIAVSLPPTKLFFVFLAAAVVESGFSRARRPPALDFPVRMRTLVRPRRTP